MTVSSFPLGPRADGSQVLVLVDDAVRIVSPSGVVTLAAGEAAQLGTLLTRVSEVEADHLEPCRCCICVEERAEGLRP